MISFKKKFDKHILKAADLFLSAQISALLKWSGYLGSDITGRVSHCPQAYSWYMVTVHLVFGHLELYLLLVDALQLSGALKALPSARAHLRHS